MSWPRRSQIARSSTLIIGPNLPLSSFSLVTISGIISAASRSASALMIHQAQVLSFGAARSLHSLGFSAPPASAVPPRPGAHLPATAFNGAARMTNRALELARPSARRDRGHVRVGRGWRGLVHAASLARGCIALGSRRSGCARVVAASGPRQVSEAATGFKKESGGLARFTPFTEGAAQNETV